METSRVATESLLQLASFELAAEEYAVDIASVQEIVRMTTVTRVPRAPSFVEGVVNLRGKIVPVIDLRRRFGLASLEATKATRIIIVEVLGKTVGLIVDAVREVLRLGSEAIEPTPDLVTNRVDTAYFKGVGKLEDRLIILLDLNRLLTAEEVSGLDPGPVA